MNRKLPPRGHVWRSRRGSILIVVLVIIAVLSLAAYAFSDLMLSEHLAVDASGRGLQARALADSGVEATLVYLGQDDSTRQQEGGIYDNATRFQGAPVIDSDVAEERGRFSVVAPAVDDDGNLAGVRFGLEDESTRLNLNALLLAEGTAENGGRELLMALPGMTEDVADAILDWIDEDDEIREFGAELETYSGLSPPYQPKNGPLETVEELLLVRGVNPQLLFGADTNRNGLLDDHEAGAGVDQSQGSMDRGWSGYLTLYSMETNLREDGSPKIDLMQEDMEELYNQLGEVFPGEWALYIVALRQNGKYESRTTGTPEESDGPASGELDFEKGGTSVLDLIGGQVRVTFKDEEDPSVLRTPFPDGPVASIVYLPALLDNVAVNASPVIPGRININQASRTVLQGVPGMTDEMVERILGERQEELDDLESPRRHETWLYSEGIATLDEMKQILPYVCAGGAVFRAQVVGYFDQRGPAARIEAVFDASAATPRLLLWRDISHLGRGYPLDMLGVQAP